MTESFLKDRVHLYQGDCQKILAELPDNSIDSCVTDPPYHLVSIVKRFGGENAAPVKVSEFYQANGESKGSSPYKRSSTGFMGKQWDGGDIAFRPETWAAVYRVLKPGAHLIAFGGTRTYHRLACAIEDAGFEIRDCVLWLYGSGFPKSHDVSKGIDKAMRGFPQGGPDPTSPNHGKFKGGCSDDNPAGRGFGAGPGQFMREQGKQIDRDLVDAARQWEGWGTALKPACEPIVLARKPLSEGTVAANVLKWGTGAINVDGCRVETGEDLNGGRYSDNKIGDDGNTYGNGINGRSKSDYSQPRGRWPANVIHDGSEEVVAAFPDTGVSAGGRTANISKTSAIYGNGRGLGQDLDPDSVRGDPGFGDSGSAARFFYTAKADSDDRIGSKHPTVKPVDLMQYLVRLITPKGGTVLDPFAGTGTTGEAAFREGVNAVLIEREDEYCGDIRRRMALALAGPDERTREGIKARGQVEHDPGPLFQRNVR